MSTKNETARLLGIPKAFRQHAARHGVSPIDMAATHRKYPVPMLNHWRDRTEAFLRDVLGHKGARL